MATKGAASASVDFTYLSDAKLEKGKKKLKEETETTWKGGSRNERREEATAEKAQKAIKKRTGGREEKGPSMKKKVGGLIAILFLCGVGLFNFVETVLGALSGTGITFLDVEDTASLKDVLFGGEPWLIYCVNNETRYQKLPKVLEDSASSVSRSIGLKVGVLGCWDQTASGRSVAQRFKFRLKPPLAFLVANGNKPRVMNLVGISKAEDIEKKAKPALSLSVDKISTLKSWPKSCTSRRTCLVIGHKHPSHRESALTIIKPLMESNRALKVVTLDTSFWSLKLDDGVLARRPPQVKGSYRADVLCLAREDGAKGNSTHSGDFLQELDSSSASRFLAACGKRESLVKIGVPPRIKAKPTKPKKVKATSPPSPSPKRKAPSPPARPKDARASGGRSDGPKVDRVGSRAHMEAADAQEALFEAVDDDEAEGESESEGGEDSSDEGEDVDEGEDDSESTDEDEVEL